MKHFLTDGFNILVDLKVQARWGDKESLEIKVSNISLLAEALEKYTKSITIELNAAELNAEVIGKLKKMIKAKSGKCKIKFKIRDMDSKTGITMLPRGNGVDPATFIRELKDNPELVYKIN